MKYISFISRPFRKYFRSTKAVNYWRQRAKSFGPNGVYNLSLNEHEKKEITELQFSIISKIMLSFKTQGFRKVLDYGCGPGRFTKLLSEVTASKVIGVDIVPEFINYAKMNDEFNDYKLLQKNTIPVLTKSIDVIFICLVLGALTENEIKKMKRELIRVSISCPKILIIENTTEGLKSNHWNYRKIEFYENLFSEFNLKATDSYFEGKEKITVFNN